MPNTQTSVPAFTSGQVLTAQQMMDVNTGIPVFATTTTRDAAFGGTGEKTLAEGQFAYIEASNTTQYYDGAAWQTVGQTPGLQYITGATFSAVTSVSLPNSTFTSTYDTYRIILTVTAFSTGANVLMRMRASGTDNTADLYRFMGVGLYSTGAGANTNGDTPNTAWNSISDANTEYLTFDVNIYRPLSADNPKRIFGTSVFSRTNNPYFAARTYGAILASGNSFDAATFYPSAGNFTGNYKVYGVSNS